MPCDPAPQRGATRAREMIARRPGRRNLWPTGSSHPVNSTRSGDERTRRRSVRRPPPDSRGEPLERGRGSRPAHPTTGSSIGAIRSATGAIGPPRKVAAQSLESTHPLGGRQKERSIARFGGQTVARVDDGLRDANPESCTDDKPDTAIQNRPNVATLLWSDGCGRRLLDEAWTRGATARE